MEPKDKAKELMDKFTQIFYPNRLSGESRALAIQISNDIVDEVINELTPLDIGYHSKSDFGTDDFLSLPKNKILYWKEVKKEINKFL